MAKYTKDVSAKVLKHFEDNFGRHCFRDDIADAVGLHPEQVTNAVYTLSARQGVPIERVTNGVWVYRPNNKKSGTLFEQIGKTKEGKILLQGEDEDLYIAERL